MAERSTANAVMAAANPKKLSIFPPVFRILAYRVKMWKKVALGD
jgi:hypothetical protein